MTLYLIILAALVAVAYGVVTRASLMKASTGNERMNEIAGAIQEGAIRHCRLCRHARFCSG